MQKYQLPKICLSVYAEEAIKNIDLLADYNFIEYRFDNLLEYNNLELLFKNKYTIVTNHNALLDNNCKYLYYNDIVKYQPTFIDIPYNIDSEIFFDVVKLIKDNRLEYIFSYHNYSSILSYIQIIELIDLAIQKEAAIIKIVINANSIDELQIIPKLYEYTANRAVLIAFSIGEQMQRTRLESLSWGAPYCYAFHNQFGRTAVGQFSFSEVKQFLSTI